MNIALIGYGRMGAAIERIATARGHRIVLRISSANKEDLSAQNLRAAEVAIEFTTPESAFDNVVACLRAGTPVVSGTTGWNDRLEEAKSLAADSSAALLHASNFSVGVHIFLEINRRLAAIMAGQPGYSVAIEEVHHLQKKDKPSGTAISLAEGILGEAPTLMGWTLKGDGQEPDAIPVTALREEGVPGTHTVSWRSDADTIDIRHTAHSRDGFALGAVLAAEFIAGRRGVFAMSDVIGL